MRYLFLIGAVVLALAAPGCERPRSRVHGVVTFQNKPLAGAVVTFFGPDNMTYNADTKPDGTYEVTGVPRGTVRVSVQVPPPKQKPRPDPPDAGKSRDTFAKEQARADDRAKMSRMPEPPPTPATPPPAAGALPAKYGDPNTSGLSFELKDADQQYPIDLK